MQVLEQQRQRRRHQHGPGILQRGDGADVTLLQMLLLVNGAVGHRYHAQQVDEERQRRLRQVGRIDGQQFGRDGDGDAGKAEHQADPLQAAHALAQEPARRHGGQQRLQRGDDAGKPGRHPLRDRPPEAGKVKTVQEDAGIDRPADQAPAARPGRSRQQAETGKGCDRQAVAQREEGEGFRMEGCKTGRDPAGGPEQHENSRSKPVEHRDLSVRGHRRRRQWRGSLRPAGGRVKTSRREMAVLAGIFSTIGQICHRRNFRQMPIA